MLPWKLLMNSLNNVGFSMQDNILNLWNIQLKLMLQNGLQKQRKNLHIQILNLKKTYKKTWISRDKSKHCLGFFTTTRLIQDWKTAEPNEVLLSECTWGHFLKKLQSYYEPTKNPIIWNFDFRQKWRKWETFSAFCNRVEAFGKTCTLCECNSDCSAEEYAIHDQIVIGRTNENICKKAMIKN